MNRPFSLSMVLVIHLAVLSPAAISHVYDLQADGQSRDRLRPAAKRTADLNAGEPRTVRLIYFLPSDRQPQPDIVAKMGKVIRDEQQRFAQIMEEHGFDRKTFRFETDEQGEPLVHRVTGQHATSHYIDAFWDTTYDEIERLFDISANIYFIVVDHGSERLGSSGRAGFTEIIGLGSPRGKSGGLAAVTAADFGVGLVGHELGHAFGLSHDLRFDSSGMITSFCAAEWFDVHPYFNAGQATPPDRDTTIQPPSLSLASPPYDIRLRFNVNDPDGLHQAQLIANGGLIDCKKLSGKSATVEFVTPLLTRGTGDVALNVMDANGNFASQLRWFNIDITNLLPPPRAISVPDRNLAATLRVFLDLSAGHVITQLDMLRLSHLFSLEGRNISDFTGLEHAINLEQLIIQKNQTRDLRNLISNIAGLTNLRELVLSFNQITDVEPLSGLTNNNLRILALRGNQITDVSSLSGLTNLRELWIDDNAITDVRPIMDLTNLRGLILDDNQITDVSSLAGLTNLRSLDLRRNQITDVSSLSGLTNLRSLSLSGNQITDVRPLAALTDLRYLELRRNQIADSSPLRELLRRNPKLDLNIDIHVPHFALGKIAGDNQTGPAGAALAEPFVVLVWDETDGKNSVISGVAVTFSVSRGDGTLSTFSATTDADGRAATTLTLGPQPGRNIVEAAVAGTDPVIFSAAGLALARDVNKPTGDEQEGTAGSALMEPFVVEVRDQDGNPPRRRTGHFLRHRRRGDALGHHRHDRCRGPRRHNPDAGVPAGDEHRSRNGVGPRSGDLHCHRQGASGF